MTVEDRQREICPSGEGTKISRDKPKMVGALLFATIFFGGGLLLAYKAVGFENMPVAKEYILLVACGIMLLLMLTMVVQLLDPRPALEFSDQGLLIREMSDQVISWTAIKRVEARRQKHAELLEVDIDENAAQGFRLKRWYVLINIGSLFTGHRNLVINTKTLTHTAEYLAELANFHMRRETSSNA